jgi:hypothetical protein
LQHAAGQLMPAERPTSEVVVDPLPQNDVVHHSSARG